MTDTDIAHIAPAPQPRRIRRRLMIALAAAVAILLLAAGMWLRDGSGSHTLHVAFEGTVDAARCLYSGPSVVSAGEVTVVFDNRSDTPGSDFVDFVRLDEGKSIQDVHEFLASDSFGRPTWVTGIWIADGVAAGGTKSTVATLEPGTYALVCGSNAPYGVFFGSGLTVRP